MSDTFDHYGDACQGHNERYDDFDFFHEKPKSLSDIARKIEERNQEYIAPDAEQTRLKFE